MVISKRKNGGGDSTSGVADMAGRLVGIGIV